MARRSYSAIFLAAVTELSDGGKVLVGNGSLREHLGWDQERYGRIKTQLVDEGRLIVGRGQGGSVGLADVPSSGISVFVSYSHHDEEIKKELVKHLEPLHRLGWIEAWHDRLIKPGEEWGKSISKSLESADLVLLLVSVDFINSSYCYDIEMDAALERHANGEAEVVPVILRSCLWQHTPFAKLQALPKDGKAVAAWVDRDEALTSVAEGVRQVVETIRSKRE
jgi:hypothetical protein